MGTDSEMESRLKALGRLGVEGSAKTEKGLMEIDNRVVTAGVGGGYKGVKW